MKFLHKPVTLFGRTALTFTFAFLIFSIFSSSVVIYFVASPLTKRAADDLAALIVLSAQIWVELPPGTRPDFEREMLKRHNLMIGLAMNTLAHHEVTHFYLHFLEQAMLARTGKAHVVYMDESVPDRAWLDIQVAGRTLRVGFTEDRLIGLIPLTMFVMVLAGTLIAVLTSLLLVRRITQPLASLAEATTRIGMGQSGEPLEEKGAQELSELARNFNHMERQLRVLMDNRTTLLAGISHDLRTPIARMQLELELLDDQADQEMVEGLRQNLIEMNELISTTLQLSRDLGEQSTESVDLDQLLREIVDAFKLREAEITLTNDVQCTSVLPVSAFRRVMNNLIENAIRYSENKPIDISCNGVAGRILIQIHDRGPGIPEEHREQVFQPFKRLEGSRSRTSGGSGLGLAIVEQLCKANDWAIELRESSYGGTTVVLSLPCENAMSS